MDQGLPAGRRTWGFANTAIERSPFLPTARTAKRHETDQKTRGFGTRMRRQFFFIAAIFWARPDAYFSYCALSISNVPSM